MATGVTDELRQQLEEELGAGRRGSLVDIVDGDILRRRGAQEEREGHQATQGISAIPPTTSATSPFGRTQEGGGVFEEYGYKPGEWKGQGPWQRSEEGGEESEGRRRTDVRPKKEFGEWGVGARMGGPFGGIGDPPKWIAEAIAATAEAGGDTKAQGHQPHSSRGGVTTGGGEGDFGRASKKPAVMPRTYDGTGDLEEFLAHFDLCVIVNGWTEKEAGTFLGISLDGTAGVLLGKSHPRPTTAEGYRALRAALIDRFRPTDQTDCYKAMLRTRTRKPEEPLHDYSEAVGRIVRLAYPDANAETIDTMTKDHFLGGLEDAELRHWIYQGTPSDLAAAVRRGLHAEAFLTEERGKTHKVRGSTKTMAEEMEALKLSMTDWMQGKMGSWMADISKKLDQPHPQVGATTAPAPKPRTCFECGSETHFKRNCPQHKAKMAKLNKEGSSPPAGN